MVKFKDFLVLVAILFMVLIVSVLATQRTAFDIQLHDTYLVIGWPEAIISLGGPLIVVVYFFRALARKFKNLGTNASLVLGLLFTSYVEIITFQVEGYQFGRAWILLVVCVVCILILVLKSINVWKNEISK
ncbi:MAG TPA: hypothetical protein VL728_00905 [Cyclobacteriaceae bacterium]|jgi:hypothetical protein|nr:hypothetical protein [Cyclobacteriaceae bacterium]